MVNLGAKILPYPLRTIEDMVKEFVGDSKPPIFKSGLKDGFVELKSISVDVHYVAGKRIVMPYILVRYEDGQEEPIHIVALCKSHEGLGALLRYNYSWKVMVAIIKDFFDIEPKRHLLIKDGTPILL